MEISVIIPVYNAAAFVERAVRSVLEQPETAEIVLVDDGSTDGSLDICQRLATEHELVHLYRHNNGENRGAGASRNLGILKSRYDFLAFLDADDLYLPDRFAVAVALLKNAPELDGVYEAVVLRAESQSSMERWQAAGRELADLVTIRETISPESLFDAMIKGGIGFFHINGLVVRRSVFDKVGLFDEHLRVVPHEDVAMNFRLAAVCRLAPGRLDNPVAIYIIHDHNNISEPRSQSQIYKGQMMLYSALWNWSKQNLDGIKQRSLLNLFVKRARNMPRFYPDKDTPKLIEFLRGRIQLLLLIIEYPDLLKTRVFWAYFLPKSSIWTNPAGHVSKS